jgi:hypothetical protein
MDSSMQQDFAAALRRYCLDDVALTSALAMLPEVSGLKTKTYEFKLRVVFPLDQYTQSVLDAGTGSLAQLELLRTLERKLLLNASDTPLTVVHLAVNERASRMFRRDDESGMVALLSITLAYSAHRAYTGSELRASLDVMVDHDRYRSEELDVTVLPNR